MKKLFNEKNPLFLLILSALLLVSTIIVPAKIVQASTDEVSLYYLDRDYRTNGFSYDTIYIKVRNLSYEKNVSVHYTYSIDNGEWKDAKATFVKSLNADYDIFKVTVSGYGDINYSIKYNVAGKDFEDNNDGKNYTHNNTLGSVPVHADRILGQWLNVLVKDFKDSNAKVELTYTTDNWKTTQIKTLEYLNTTHNGELVYNCYLSIPYDTLSSTSFEFAVSYTVNGVTYWDNNFNNNYNYINHHVVL